jgi:Tfp pilus assembly protein PilN
MMWLTDLKQTPGQSEVVIEGRCTALTGLSDFVSNLEASGYFKKSVEIVNTRVEAQGGVEFIKFSVRARFQPPAPAAAVAAAPAAAAKPAT